MAALPDAGKGVGAHREDSTKEKSQAATLPPAIPASIARNAPLAISSWSNRSARSLPALKLRGLPFSATEVDVRNFFSGFELLDVLFVLRDAPRQPSGIVFVLLGTSELADVAMAQHNKGIMGRRSAKVQRQQQKKYTPPVPIVPRVRPRTGY